MRSALSLFASGLSSVCVLSVALGACSSSSSSSPAATDGGADAPSPEGLEAARKACTFKAGARAVDTIGAAAQKASDMPIEHVIVVMRENRSFDQYFGQLPKFGQTDIEAWPDSYSNNDPDGAAVKPYHLDTTCFRLDPPHQWTAMHEQYNDGKMDGFALSAGKGTASDGHFALGYFDGNDLPFYYFLANTYSVGDHNFSSVMSGTFANRDYLVLGSSYGVKNTLTDGYPPATAKSIFDLLDEKSVSWGVYTSEDPLEGTLNWPLNHKGVGSIGAMLQAIGDGSLPAVSFVDSKANVDDEHPPADVQLGEAFTKKIYDALVKSPIWGKSVMFVTWDESGGQFDHVVPPSACVPSDDQAEFSQLGFRVPLIAVSPWAKKHFVSHAVHEHTSILRFIETRWDLPALTARDANTDALLDMFDFGGQPQNSPPQPPGAGTGGCK